MQAHESFHKRHFTLVAVAFEAGLGLAAVVLGWLFDVSPWGTLTHLDAANWVRAGLWSVIAATLLSGAMILGDRYPIGMLRDLRTCVERDVLPLFRRTSVGGLLLISLAAGVGEELLFRGFLQAVIADRIGAPAGPWIGLTLAAILFGACHWLCAAYGILATGIGMLLGLMFLVSGSLAAPMLTHGLYDFLVLLYLLRGTRSRP